LSKISEEDALAGFEQIVCSIEARQFEMKQDRLIFSNGKLTADGSRRPVDRRAVITRQENRVNERFHGIPKFSMGIQSEAEVGADLRIF
jgi:hypothetical protein